jgi:predicted small lipoprotein YifL
MQKLLFSCLILALAIFSGCDDKKPLEIPENYVSADFAANTTLQATFRGQMEAFVTEAKKGRTNGAIVNAATLLDLYNAGNPSLKDLTTTYYADRLNNGTNGWIFELANASGLGYTPGTTSGQGGTFNGYLFDENGLEMEQMLDKGLFGAAFYNYALRIMDRDLTTTDVDQLLSIYGAHPDFPNTPTASKAANPDKFMANYAARRDKNDGLGLYAQMKTHFITLKAAVETGDDYAEEREQALADIRLTWEKINAGTVINYCHSVIATMSGTNVSDSDKAKALHAYGECVGFIHGWRTIAQNSKVLTDTEIDEILALLNAEFNKTPTSYLFITEPAANLPKLQDVIAKLKARFAFTDAEVEDFKKNWVAEQGR